MLVIDNESGQSMDYVLPLTKGKNISEAVLKERKHLLRSLEENFKKEYPHYNHYQVLVEKSEKIINEMFDSEYMEQISKYVQLVLYLLADNKEMEESPSTAAPQKFEV